MTLVSGQRFRAIEAVFMEIVHRFFLSLDPWLVWAFRLTEDPWAGFLTGCVLTCLICVILGDATSILARRLNRGVYGRYHDEMVRNHNLSVTALRLADKAAYAAANKQAHEAFGRYFFSQAGAFTLSIWPFPFVLGWMETRFGGVPLTLPMSVPGVGDEVMYPFFCIPLYILMRIVYGRIMRLFAPYRRVLTWTGHGGKTEMLRFEDLLRPDPARTGPETAGPEGSGKKGGRHETGL